MKTMIGIIALLLFILVSCETTQEDPILISEAEPVAVQPDPEPKPIAEAKESEDSYSVTQEVYEQTFDEIKALILELNSIISKGNFVRWADYLSNAYIRTYGDDDTLAAINQYPQLEDNGIVLKSLKDYFDWVVVPSHSRAVLVDIVFVGETEVIAYSSFEGKRAKLYKLERLDGKWKITVW